MGSTRVGRRVALDTYGGGDLVAQALIVELSLVELDEQPKLDGVLSAQAASTEALAASGEARARARIFE